MGADFPNAKGPSRRFELAICQRGEPVELRLEPDNPADPLAVAVYSCRGIQLGYLTAERCGRIGGLMKNGHDLEAVFQDHTEYGAVIRVAFDGALMQLPPTVSQRPPDPDFWPDEQWDDDFS